MLETVRSLVFDNPLEFYTAVVATIGVVCWFLDRRSMKAALEAAKGQEETELRLKRQQVEMSVERSFAALQIKCRAIRDEHKDHEWRNGPKLSVKRYLSEGEKDSIRIEREGATVFKSFKASAPDTSCTELREIEAYFSNADRTSIQFERLASELKGPRDFRH